jgi:hypothetical protein
MTHDNGEKALDTYQRSRAMKAGASKGTVDAIVTVTTATAMADAIKSVIGAVPRRSEVMASRIVTGRATIVVLHAGPSNSAAHTHV